MILGPVLVGKDSSLGINSVVAHCTTAPDNCHLGLVTSSYEESKNLDAKHARANRNCLPEPSLWMQLLVGGPILFFVNALSEIPPFAVLLLMPILFFVNALSEIPPFAVLLLMLRFKGEEGDFNFSGAVW